MLFLETILPIFGKTLLPVFLVAAAGALLARQIVLDGQTLGRIVFYLATPALVFRTLYELQVDTVALQRIALIAVLLAILTGLLGWLAAADQTRSRRAAFILTSAVPNSGNMGLPISLFAFGTPGLAIGAVYYVVTTFLSNTVGVAVASAGQASVGTALRQSLRVPVFYAALAGLICNRSGITVPIGLFRAVDLLANAAIPGMLVLLGIQLQRADLRGTQWSIARVAGIRLLAAPLLAWLLCSMLNMPALERSVITLQAAMPTAVMTAVLATEYKAAPRLTAAVIFFTTALSMITLSAVLWYIL